MKVDKMGRLMPFNIIMRKHSCNIMILTSPSLWIQCDKWMFPHFLLLMDLIGWLVTLQRTWRLMWRASCLTVWTLKDWALHTQRQTTVTPAWTKLGYDGSKSCGHSLNVTRWRGRGENIPKKQTSKLRRRENGQFCYCTAEHISSFVFTGDTFDVLFSNICQTRS